MRLQQFIGLLFLCLLSLACGRKGSPHPPEENAPRSVQYFKASGDINAIILSWSAPSETASGGSIKDLANFVVQRRNVVGDETGSFGDIAIVSINPDEGLKKQFSYTDTAVQPGQVYDYLVYATAADGQEGENDKILRVTFRGQTSTVDTQNSLDREIAP